MTVRSRCGRLPTGVLVLAVVLGVVPSAAGAAPGSSARVPQALRVQVRAALPHDREAFTQGLELHDGLLYEGTGLTGRSVVTAGPVGGEPSLRVALGAEFFGEGITVVGDRLWQLTWREGVAFERDARTLAELRRVRYEGEGWGLCAQPDRLVMSDGSSTLFFRDPRDFGKRGSVAVTENGRPLERLNELECAPDGSVYANVWPTDRIVRIDPASGEVTAAVDASGLLGPADRTEGVGVLNGIAHIPGTDEYLVTGKNWPRMFRVAFVPA
ncbi:glutaminyl-peptide cyclotransferase [Streptomyces sp. NPDC001581]|uniref:glutaminyl-peptide cyclotransferase n=1 Tax=Streptomyces sp. NPDC001581 TaxID=3154386 RepID=UPI003326A35C